MHEDEDSAAGSLVPGPPTDPQSEAEAEGPPTFISYAQHGEDVVLWRALRDVTPGNYVDVGAADPTEFSVTRAFYERGWRGIDIEPTAVFAAALTAARPDDVVVQCAAGAESGEVRFFEVDGTGLSTLDETNALSAAERGFDVAEHPVPVRTLDDILAENWDPAREIHFLKIDVEGAEADVLAGIDLDRWRPWVVVVEATAPLSTESTRAMFESLLTSSGYVPTMFDGLNVYYASPDHPDLVDALSYPAGPLDVFVPIALHEATLEAAHERMRAAHAANAALWEARWAETNAELIETAITARRERGLAARQLRQARRNKAEAEAALERLRQTPLRRARRSMRAALHRLGGAHGGSAADSADSAATEGAPARPEPLAAQKLARQPGVLRDRLAGIVAAVEPGGGASDDRSLAELLPHVAKLVERAANPEPLLWVLHIAFLSRFPTSDELTQLRARYELCGAVTLLDDLRREGLAARPTWASIAPMRLVTEPVIDVSHTAFHELHTGIQRVVREVVPRWVAEDGATLAAFDTRVPVYRTLSPIEESRVLDWAAERPPEQPASDREIIVPWQSTLVLPELAGETGRADRILALAQGSGSKLDLILFDLIPFTKPTACADGMHQAFGNYMKVVRHARRITTISRATAQDMDGFSLAYVNQGLPRPAVSAHPLPLSARVVAPDVVDRLRSSVLGTPGIPLVLSVSSIEPRKNHVTTLLAAERLWNEGHQFQLVFISGSGWNRDVFDTVLAELKDRGRPVRVISQASEDLLWSAYHLARFTVFVSLAEGFGLPAAESIATGTPVILSGFGSMRDIGEGGGAQFVDPRALDEVAGAMRTLLTDDERLAELAAQARGRRLPTWDEYATDTWNWLIHGKETGHDY